MYIYINMYEYVYKYMCLPAAPGLLPLARRCPPEQRPQVSLNPCRVHCRQSDWRALSNRGASAPPTLFISQNVLVN